MKNELSLEESFKNKFPEINKLVTNIFQEQSDDFYEWLRDVIYPDISEKKPRILVLQSIHQGVGKSTLIDLIKRLMGYDMKVLNPVDLHADFNGHITNKLISIDGFDFKRKNDVEHLVLQHSAAVARLNEKNMPSALIRVRLNFIVTSNNVPILRKSRFWLVNIPNVNDKEMADTSKFNHELKDFTTFLRIVL